MTVLSLEELERVRLRRMKRKTKSKRRKAIREIILTKEQVLRAKKRTKKKRI
jgi:hypothetical protein